MTVACGVSAVKGPELRLRVWTHVEGREIDVVAHLQQPGTVDLSCYPGLVSLPEGLRAHAAQVRELIVRSSSLDRLPDWLGELTSLEVLVVRGEVGDEDGEDETMPRRGCPLRALPESIAALQRLQTLHLQHCHALTALPESLEALTGLRDLDLTGCPVEIPRWVLQLQGLQVPFEELRVQIHDADSAFFTHESLEKALTVLVRRDRVDLAAYPGIVALPEDLRALAGGVQELLVKSDQLTVLPDWLGDMTSLTLLRVTGCSQFNPCPLQALPDTVTRLTALRELELRWCDKVTALPDGGAVWSRLEDLRLIGCTALKDVPTWVLERQKLKGPFEEWRLQVRTLAEPAGEQAAEQESILQGGSVSREYTDREEVSRVRRDVVDLTAHSGLVALPEQLRACAAGVRELCVRSDQLTVLPEWFGELEALEVLRLGGWMLGGVGGHASGNEHRFDCPVQELPSQVAGLTRLHTLVLHSCVKLTALPDGLLLLTGLRTLIIPWCSGLAALPEGIAALTRLNALDLEGCTSMTALPNAIGALTCLVTLDVKECTALTALPEAIGALTRLETLDLEGCSALTSIPEGLRALTRLQDLWIFGAQSVTQLPDISSLTGLDTLGIVEVPVQTIPALGELTQLRYLTLDDLRELKELDTLPAALEHLEILGCDKLQALPRSTCELSALRRLSLHYLEQVRELPDELCLLTRLENLDLRFCDRLEQLPASVKHLTGLQVLTVEMCGINDVPSLETLTSLQGLKVCLPMDVPGGAFKSVARALPCLKRLHSLALGIFSYHSFANPRELNEVIL